MKISFFNKGPHFEKGKIFQAFLMMMWTEAWWHEAGATAVAHVHDQVCSQVVAVPR